MNYMVLVNKENLVKDVFYKNLELIETLDTLDEKVQIEKKTYQAYLELKNHIKEELNIEIGIDSAFRSKEQQQQIHDEFVVKYGEDYANSIVAPVGASEHHTGLAIDISIKKDGKFLIDNYDLEKEDKTFQKIHKYISEFGFILRYPKGKDDITGYPYEPWHIRYVGKLPAKIITENNITLEEYFKDYSGILSVNKEKNMTSRDVVNYVSKILGIKKIGHTGTLDPMAEGVLVLTIGKATKLGELLTTYEKEYIAEVEVGKLTDTLDITGNVIKEKNLDKTIDYHFLCNSFQKKYLQEVPLYSAVKVNGKKLYEYARNKEDVILPKKEVEIKKIELLESNEKKFKFKVLVSKGTYIRSLIRDMGNFVGEYFSMSSLVRTKQGNYSINNSYTLGEIERGKCKILSIDEALKNYPVIDISDEKILKKVKNGVKIKNNNSISDKVLFKYKDKAIAIYEKCGEFLKPWKIL